MADITITVTEIVDGLSVASAPTSLTVYDGVFVNTGGGTGGAVSSVNGHTGAVVLAAADVGAATTAQGAKADTAVQPGSLGTAAALDVPATGDATTAQVVKGTDTRLSDSRTPTTHTHTASQISDSTTVGRAVVTAVDAAAARTAIGAGTSSLAIGVTGTTAAAGNDSRLSDARTPTAHAASHASAGTDPVTLAASQIGSGTVATARLGSGVADSTKFLRGDQTWATPAGGGTVTSVTAGDTTITVGGTAADPTIAVNAIAESKVTNLVADLAAKAPLASPTFTGTPAAPTVAGTSDSTTKLATTAFVQAVAALLAPLASPALTGNPTAPTQTAGDNSTKVATTAYVDGGRATRQINAQVGTAYTLVLSDAGKWVTMTNAAASTLTVPPNSSVAFPVGTLIDGSQLGAGQVTLTPGAGVTINGTPGLKVAAQYGTFALLKTATDTWLAMGRLSA